MSFRKLAVKLSVISVALGIVALAVLSGPAAMAAFTRYFCTAAVGVFAVASTVGLASRLRA